MKNVRITVYSPSAKALRSRSLESTGRSYSRGLRLLFTLCTVDFGITPWHLAATIIGQPVTESHNVSKSVLLIVQHDSVR